MMIKLKNEGFVQEDETEASDELKSTKLTVGEVVAQGTIYLIYAF